MRHSRSFVLAVACAALFTTSTARAAEFVLPKPSDDPAHQCHNPHLSGMGGYQIDWDGLGFDSGNPHGALHVSGDTNVRIDMSTQFANLGTLERPPTGNTLQTTNTLIFGSGAGATFNFSNITSILLENAEPIDFRGTRVDPLEQLFKLTITTTTDTFVFDLETIMGSGLNFDRNGNLRSVNLRFCASLRTDEPPPPPEVPEPTTLFGAGLAALAGVRTLRRKLG